MNKSAWIVSFICIFMIVGCGAQTKEVIKGGLDFDQYLPLQVGHSWVYLYHDGNSGIHSSQEYQLKITKKQDKKLILMGESYQCEVFSFEASRELIDQMMVIYSEKDADCFIRCPIGIFWGKSHDGSVFVGSPIILAQGKPRLNGLEATEKYMKQDLFTVDWEDNSGNFYTHELVIPTRQILEYLSEQILDPQYPEYISFHSIWFSKGLGMVNIADYYSDGGSSFGLIRTNF